jgi:hypothetical protein
MNRTLRRPMFRTGGSAEGITSGLSRQGYSNGQGVGNPGFGQPQHFPKENASAATGDTQSIMNNFETRMNILDAKYPREKTSSMAGPNFLMNFGVDLATRPRGGNILQQAAASAKNPLLQFQQEKLMEQAAGRKETSEDRALLASMLEGMDDEKLSAMMKDVKKGVEAGYYKDEMDGIRRKLAEEEFGDMDMPGEAREKRISVIEDKIIRADPDDWGVARKIAEHKYKIEAGEYPKELEEDLNQTKFYIKHLHIVDTVKDKDTGEVEQILADAKYDYYYTQNQIYFDPQTGYLFKRVSTKGKAPVFTRIFED